MIINYTLIKADGTTQALQREVPDNFLDTTEPPLDELTLTQLAIAELAEAQETAQTANELALAELAELIIGGE